MQQKQHWEKVFETKADTEKSWFQSYPETSVQFIKELNIPKDAAIIDVGGGDSYLVDALVQEGYKDITVLDISGKALQNTQKRLGKNAGKVKWIESDVLHFHPPQKYDCWHDRAVFHFVTDDHEIKDYKKQIADSVKEEGKLIVGTFSEKGLRNAVAFRFTAIHSSSLPMPCQLISGKLNVLKKYIKHLLKLHSHSHFAVFKKRRKLFSCKSFP